MSSVFKKRSRRVGSEPSSDADENPPILKMAEREDWALFRSIEGLAAEGGRRRLLGCGGWCSRSSPTTRSTPAADIELRTDRRREGSIYFIEDDGPGLDGTPEEIASLFSIAPPDALHQAAAAAAARRARQWPARGRRRRAGLGGLAGRHHPQSAHRAPPASGRLDHRRERDGGRSARSAPASRSASVRRCRTSDAPFAWVEAAADIAPRWQDLRRQVLAVLVRPGAIPRAYSCLWIAAAAQSDRAIRRLQRRQGR